MMTLPATGTLSYGSPSTGTVVFDGLTRTKVTVKPIMDEAGRVLVYNAITLEVDARISGSPTDVAMSSLRYILTQPGLALHYDGKGFATLFSVNDTTSASGFVDCAWGPTPELLTYNPIGSNEGALVTWRVTVHVKECSPGAGPNANNKLLAFNYEQGWQISEDGLTTRTTTGYLEIGSQEGRLSQSVSYYADTFREKANLPLLTGFKRTQNYKMDKSKRRLDFTFVDTEVPYPLPQGATRCQATHTIESGLDKGFMLWQGTISATITMGPAPFKKSDSIDRFMLIVTSRIGGARANIANMLKVGKLQPVNGENPTVMLHELLLGEEVFDRPNNFSVRYAVVGCDLNTILGISGLWTATPGIDFNSWKASMGAAWGPRGSAGLQTVPGDDVLLELCHNTPQPPRGTQAGAGGVAAPARQRQLVQVGAQIDPKASWIHFRCKVVYDEDDRIAVHKPLTGAAAAAPVAPPYDLLGSSGSSSGGSLPGNAVTGASTVGGPAPGVRATVPDIVQRVSAPTYRIRVVGEAMRLEYRVPVPAAASIGGQTATQTDRHVEEEQLAAIGGIPIFYASWDVGYILPGTPSDLGAPANPQFGTPGFSGSAANLAG